MMLLRFETANHRSIKEPIELSMIAVDNDRPAARGFDRIPEKALTVAAIYGPNASGKSNVLEALGWLSAAVDHSLRQWRDRIPREPFRFADGPATASTFDVDMVVGGIRYAYSLEVDDTSVIFETLASYPERRRRVLFERSDMEVSFRRGLSGLSGTRELLTPVTLALSAAMRFGDPEVGAFGRALASVDALNLPRRVGRRVRAMPLAPGIIPHHFDDTADLDERAIALQMLRFADLGINDVEVIRDDTSYEPEFRLVHRAGDQLVPFDLAEESAGTRVWFALIGPVLDALRAGSVLLFDEIDASLHPRLSAHLLALFQDPATNPRGAQLIFTTHDTSLLGHLNRDEVWLTEKSDGGATSLTALAEYGGDKVRRSTNLERAYLQGRFGALPHVDESALRRALRR
jgi:uncharacterized protein